MTKELAIKILSGDTLGTNEQTHEAVCMAVKALTEQRHGHWKEHKDYPGLAYLCSDCGYFTTNKTYYCPYCGARMDKPTEERDIK